MYKDFAFYYDQLNDFDYADLANRIKKHLKAGRVLDLACGTGRMISLLSDEFEMIGSDFSEEMLEVARGRNSDVSLFVHDLRDDFYVENIDNIICTVDSLNYLTSEDDLKRVFENVYNNITDGVFIFDVHAESKLERMNDYIHVDLDEDVSYIWKTNVVDNNLYHFLTFFIQEEGVYYRFDEEHIQRVYSEKIIDSLLSKFEFKKEYLEDRILYICKKA